MNDKLVGLKEAAEIVTDGALLGLTSTALDNSPMALLRQLVRLGVDNLKVATMTGGGLNIDLLIGAGVVAEYETCACTMGEWGPAPNFQRAIREGLILLKDST